MRALASQQGDPRYTVWLKSEPARLTNPESAEYQALFPATLTGVAMVNAVLCHNAIRTLVVSYEQRAAARSQEKLIYRHAIHVITAVMMKRLRQRIGAAAVIDAAAIPGLISQPLDELRQQTFDLKQQQVLGEGPLAYFRNQGSVVSFMADLMATHFGLTADPTLPTLRNINTAADAYPRKRLLDYLSGKAPNYESDAMSKQKLELTWIGKEKRPKLEPRILREEPDKSYHAKQRVTENDIFDNRLIFGDNLLALKALEAEFAGKVKCVFIDPPYNTGSAFKQYDDGLEHSIWLGLMRDRLEIIRRLLADDGSLWITIDDNEAQYLKVLCDEVFGRACFVTTFIWKKVDSPNDNKVPITPDHEYLLCFTKTPGSRPFRQKYDDSILAAYRKPDAESDRPYRDRLLKKNGKNSLRSDRPSMFFPLTAPDGTEVLPIHDDGREARWAMGKTSVEDLIEKRVDLEKARNRLDSLYPRVCTG